MFGIYDGWAKIGAASYMDTDFQNFQVELGFIYVIQHCDLCCDVLDLRIVLRVCSDMLYWIYWIFYYYTD